MLNAVCTPSEAAGNLRTLLQGKGDGGMQRAAGGEHSTGSSALKR